MASKRMFTMQIVDSDAFLSMPPSAQALYYHLCMRADDEGFLNNARSVMHMVGCAESDLKVLKDKGFVITFDSGIIVIKHWQMHNRIRSDRLRPTDKMLTNVRQMSA